MKVADLATITDKILDDAVDWYGQVRVPRELRACHPYVLRRALKLAGGDPRRLTIEHGYIVVHNRPVWG